MSAPDPRPLKVAITIPVYGMTHAKFTQSLANLLVHSLGADLRDADGAPLRLEIETFMVSCSMLTEARHRLVAEALAWGAERMLCLDADHVFPPDALLRLLAHNLPAVGCNYPRRFTPTAPTAAGAEGSLYTTRAKAEAAWSSRARISASACCCSTCEYSTRSRRMPRPRATATSCPCSSSSRRRTRSA